MQRKRSMGSAIRRNDLEEEIELLLEERRQRSKTMEPQLLSDYDSDANGRNRSRIEAEHRDVLDLDSFYLDGRRPDLDRGSGKGKLKDKSSINVLRKLPVVGSKPGPSPTSQRKHTPLLPSHARTPNQPTRRSRTPPQPSSRSRTPPLRATAHSAMMASSPAVLVHPPHTSAFSRLLIPGEAAWYIVKCLIVALLGPVILILLWEMVVDVSACVLRNGAEESVNGFLAAAASLQLKECLKIGYDTGRVLVDCASAFPSHHHQAAAVHHSPVVEMGEGQICPLEFKWN
tara:strand:- start:1720 stop:2580 length:861 start_codon:yes stop_codon:yes gene_type:complete